MTMVDVLYRCVGHFPLSVVYLSFWELAEFLLSGDWLSLYDGLYIIFYVDVSDMNLDESWIIQ
jgi:hypothetical protein